MGLREKPDDRTISGIIRMIKNMEDGRLPLKGTNLNKDHTEPDDRTVHDPRYRPELQNRQAVRETNTIRIIGILLFLISMGIALFGFIESNESLSFSGFIKEFYANISAELGSIPRKIDYAQGGKSRRLA